MAKNLHLEHLEDEILNKGVNGAMESIKMLEDLGKFLSEDTNSNLKITTKFDGAPAIICGTDPADNRFFVGTKSVFAKTDPKIMKSRDQISQTYDGELASKLMEALAYLPSCGIRGVLQGDLMFTNDKKTETIQGKTYTTFRPNTITYAADPKTKLGKDINAAKLGIVFHTKYTGSSLPEMNASFMIADNDFKSSSDVWAEKAEFQDISGVASFQGGEKSKYDSAVNMAEGSLKQTRGILNKIQSGKKALQMDTEFLKFFNNYVKAGQNIPSVDRAYNDFLFHMGKEYDKVIVKNKTLKAQANKAGKFIEMLAFAEDNKRDLKMLIASYMNITYAKNILVEKMKKVSSLKLFVNMGTYYQATTPEGFVGLVDGQATKLIDRLEFAHLNFTVPKQWD